MAKSKTINFALLGLGKLGVGFYRIFNEKKDKIKQETGFNLELKKILIKNSHFRRPSFVDETLLTTKLEDITTDKSIDVAVDAIGGIEPTYSIIRKLITNNIHIVSANRMLLASKMHELADLANANHTYIQPEPSLGGGISIINTLQRDLVANDIRSVYGVVSGTSNYILSEMARQGTSLDKVLQQPELQKLSESLSVIDYEGSDAAQKVSILAASAFGVDISFLHIFAEGISEITSFDIKCAREFGYELKLLAILKEHEKSFEIRVHPTLVPLDHPINMVRGDYNAFFIETDLLGNYMLYGRGVGIEATCSLILRDIIAIGNLQRQSSVRKDSYRFNWKNKPMLAIDEIRSAYYIRFPCLDRPGVIGEITSLLGQHDINIGSAHAEVDKDFSTELGFVHILIDSAMEKDIHRALDDIRQKDIIRDKIKLFRIL